MLNAILKCHVTGPHALSHEISAFIYILILIWTPYFSCSLDKNTKINNTYPFKIDRNYKGFTCIYWKNIKKKGPLKLQGDIHEIILMNPRRNLHSTI